MKNKIYDYLKYNLNIETTYKFTRDYISNPLKRGKNQYDTEHFNKDDLYHLFIELNIRLKDIMKMFNMKEKSVRRELLYYNIKKSPLLVGKNDLETYNKKSDEEKDLLIQKSISKKYINGVYNNNIDKRIKTNIERYGTEDVNRKNWSDIAKKITVNGDLLKEYIEKNNITNGRILGDYLGISSCVANKLIRKYDLVNLMIRNVSKDELEIREFVNHYYKTINNSRQIIPPFELDIYIPKLNIAIEYNGDYWHSSEQVKKKDLTKQKYCQTKGIKLITITETEWLLNKELVLTQLKEHLFV